MNKSKILLTALLVAPLVQGCVAAAAGVVGGVLLGQEVLEDDVYHGFVEADSQRTWNSVKATLNNASLKPIDVDDVTRKAEAEIDSAKVTVTVETYDLNRTKFRVSARKHGFANGTIAKGVFDRIITDLERR